MNGSSIEKALSVSGTLNVNVQPTIGIADSSQLGNCLLANKPYTVMPQTQLNPKPMLNSSNTSFQSFLSPDERLAVDAFLHRGMSKSDITLLLFISRKFCTSLAKTSEEFDTCKTIVEYQVGPSVKPTMIITSYPENAGSSQVTKPKRKYVRRRKINKRK